MQHHGSEWYDGIHSVSPAGYIWMRGPFRQHPMDPEYVVGDDDRPLETPFLTSRNWLDDVSFQVGYQRPAQRMYRALEQPLLFREFADLWRPEIDDELLDSIIRFANEYGRLGGSAQIYFHRRVPDDALIRTMDLPGREGRYVLSMGDALTEWHSAIEDMNTATELWDLIVEEDTDALAQLITIQDDGTVQHQRRELIGGMIDAESLVSAGWDGTALDAAEIMIGNVVSWQLVSDRINARVVRDPDTRRSRIVHVPESLLSAMWLQLAQAIEDRSPYRRCIECRRWFTYDPKKMRNGVVKVYCSKACKMKRYHRTQRELADVVDGGRSLV